MNPFTWLWEHLNHPYPGNPSDKSALRFAIGAGLFVSLFLWVFQPFGLSEHRCEQHDLYVLGFGPITTFATLLAHIVARGVFPYQYKTQSWRVWKEIVFILFLISLIAMGNMVYASIWDNEPISLRWYIFFLYDTLVVGVFPVTGSVIIREIVLLRQSENLSAQLNEELHALEEAQDPSGAKTVYLNEEVELRSEETRESHRLRVTDLLYIMAEGNYVEIVVTYPDKVRKLLLRATLKSMEEQLMAYPFLFRCHRSYLVNINQISHVSGNSQGLLLSVANHPETVPVSRSRSEDLKKRLAEALPLAS